MVAFMRVSRRSLIVASVAFGLQAISFGGGSFVHVSVPSALADSGHGKGSGNGSNGGSNNGGSNNGGSNNGMSHEARAGDADSKKDSGASDLGSLNASHASISALAHASPNSRVGKIAAYKAAVLALNADTTRFRADQAVLDNILKTDPTCASQSCKGAQARVTADLQATTAATDKAAAALVAASNKPVTVAVVTKVDSNLKLVVDAQTTATIAATADKLQ